MMNQDLNCMLQRGVFEDLMRNTIVNASLPQLNTEEEVSCYGEFSAASLKSQLMLWNIGEYCRKACFPQLKSCFLKSNNQMLFFNKTMLLPTLQRPPKHGLRTSPSGLCFGRSESSPIENIWSHILINCLNPPTLNRTTLTLHSVSLPTRLKHLKKSKGKNIPN